MMQSQRAQSSQARCPEMTLTSSFCPSCGMRDPPAASPWQICGSWVSWKDTRSAPRFRCLRFLSMGPAAPFPRCTHRLDRLPGVGTTRTPNCLLYRDFFRIRSPNGHPRPRQRRPLHVFCVDSSTREKRESSSSRARSASCRHRRPCSVEVSKDTCCKSSYLGTSVAAAQTSWRPPAVKRSPHRHGVHAACAANAAHPRGDLQASQLRVARARARGVDQALLPLLGFCQVP
mmetsp:Transcript_59851/g.129711  ORF Transcript_59851/g.129711 Transcript_59851/m.129711 type:complete len:231 (-) Transcript_59851:1719-2411(-)